MPLYEILAISKANLHTQLTADLLKISATTVLSKGGAVRSFKRLNTDTELPFRMRKDKVFHTHGSYWQMHFFSNPLVANQLVNTLKTDSRVLRVNIVKLGEKLDDFVLKSEKTIRGLNR
ncbi:28S ribosomal protein S6, mitochondrial [Smittium mucronatum]|uniref:28S ribosomal protein S6, mitochondrial n=1 Tax=Smittium mucronatum TaxID=133383 RepID=A0A1R0GUT6_9FUNG|nr:28S ribosomal protein S6, mitochondrial [Smittium mucronatum]